DDGDGLPAAVGRDRPAVKREADGVEAVRVQHLGGGVEGCRYVSYLQLLDRDFGAANRQSRRTAGHRRHGLFEPAKHGRLLRSASTVRTVRGRSELNFNRTICGSKVEGRRFPAEKRFSS